jgi:hypothetical protein
MVARDLLTFRPLKLSPCLSLIRKVEYAPSPHLPADLINGGGPVNTLRDFLRPRIGRVCLQIAILISVPASTGNQRRQLFTRRIALIAKALIRFWRLANNFPMFTDFLNRRAATASFSITFSITTAVLPHYSAMWLFRNTIALLHYYMHILEQTIQKY